MTPEERARAVAAAISMATAEGLKVDDAVVLQDSNRIVLRLRPCDVVARVAPAAHQQGAAFELEVARQLAAAGAPVAGPEPRVAPRVYSHDGFAVTFWKYHEQAGPRRVARPDLAPQEYAEALERLHAGMRQVDIAAPHFTDRVAEAQALVDDPSLTPSLVDADRLVLSGALRSLRRTIVDRSATDQLLHGEPHAGNLLRTAEGLLFTDLETCCTGPVEFDIAHCSRLNADDGAPWSVDAATPWDVSAMYAGADEGLVRACWVLMLAMVAAWRWDANDQFPDGRRMGMEYLAAVRAAVDRFGLDS